MAETLPSFMAQKLPIPVAVYDLAAMGEYDINRIQGCAVRGHKVEVQTVEGSHTVDPGRWYVIRGPEGDVWPIRRDIFDKTYERLS